MKKETHNLRLELNNVKKEQQNIFDHNNKLKLENESLRLLGKSNDQNFKKVEKINQMNKSLNIDIENLTEIVSYY